MKYLLVVITIFLLSLHANAQSIDYTQEIRFPDDVIGIKNRIDYLVTTHSIPISYGNNIPLATSLNDNKTTYTLNAFLNTALKDAGINHIRTKSKILLIPDNPVKSVVANASNINARFKGNIVDSKTKKPIDCATIFISELKKGAVCDQFGNFSVETLDLKKKTPTI
jgi:hypothetical protein